MDLWSNFWDSLLSHYNYRLLWKKKMLCIYKVFLIYGLVVCFINWVYENLRLSFYMKYSLYCMINYQNNFKSNRKLLKSWDNCFIMIMNFIFQCAVWHFWHSDWWGCASRAEGVFGLAHIPSVVCERRTYWRTRYCQRASSKWGVRLCPQRLI